MNKLKLLFYISTIRGGGAARVMVNIANGLHREGDVICFVTNFPSDHEYELDNGINRISLETTENKGNIVSKNISRIKSLRKVLKSEQPDVSIAFMGENNFRLLLAAHGLNTKTIISVRNDPAREYGKVGHKQLANFLFSKADGIVFQTDDAKSWFSHNIQEKSKVIFNQVDDKFFNENLNEGEYIVACGRLSLQKNYPVMLKAFAKVLNELPDEKLRIYGEGELKVELMNFAEKLGIDNSVQFMGFSTEMEKVYQHAKLLVMSSDYEGMPNAVLEALASSVPVVSTNCPCGGPKMVICDGENGFLVPVGDSGLLSSSILRVLTDKDTHLKMKKNAFEMAKVYRSGTVLSEWRSFIGAVRGK